MCHSQQCHAQGGEGCVLCLAVCLSVWLELGRRHVPPSLPPPHSLGSKSTPSLHHPLSPSTASPQGNNTLHLGHINHPPVLPNTTAAPSRRRRMPSYKLPWRRIKEKGRRAISRNSPPDKCTSHRWPGIHPSIHPSHTHTQSAYHTHCVLRGHHETLTPPISEKLHHQQNKKSRTDQP